MISRGPFLLQSMQSPSPLGDQPMGVGSKPPLTSAKPPDGALPSVRSLGVRVEELMSCTCTLPAPFFLL